MKVGRDRNLTANISIYSTAALLTVPDSIMTTEETRLVQVCVTLKLSPSMLTAIALSVNAIIFSMDAENVTGMRF